MAAQLCWAQACRQCWCCPRMDQQPQTDPQPHGPTEDEEAQPHFSVYQHNFIPVLSSTTQHRAAGPRSSPEQPSITQHSPVPAQLILSPAQPISTLAQHSTAHFQPIPVQPLSSPRAGSTEPGPSPAPAIVPRVPASVGSPWDLVPCQPPVPALGEQPRDTAQPEPGGPSEGQGLGVLWGAGVAAESSH